MTREEEIKKQAEKKALEPSRLMHPYAKQYKVMSAYEIGFIEGAEWADQHPHWISVEDELPKKNGRYLVFNGITKDQEIFVYSNGIWWYNADRIPNMIVSHWMHLPQPPKEGGTQ